jgi:hypothetical protein
MKGEKEEAITMSIPQPTHKRKHEPKLPGVKLQRARITLECSLEQRRAIRILAAQQDKSMNEFILSLVEKEQKACHFCETYGPSEKTIRAIEQLEQNEEVEHHASAESFWESFYKEVDDTKNQER